MRVCSYIILNRFPTSCNNFATSYYYLYFYFHLFRMLQPKALDETDKTGKLASFLLRSNRLQYTWSVINVKMSDFLCFFFTSSSSHNIEGVDYDNK